MLLEVCKPMKQVRSAVMRTFTSSLLVALAALLSVGCQATCDPHTDGFFTGISGLLSKCYPERVAIKEQKLREEREREVQFEQDVANKRAEKAEMHLKLKEAKERLAELEASIRNQRSRLEQEQRLTAADEAELQKVEAQVKILKAKIMVAEAKTKERSTERPSKETIEEINQIKEEIEHYDSLTAATRGGEVR